MKIKLNYQLACRYGAHNCQYWGHVGDLNQGREYIPAPGDSLVLNMAYPPRRVKQIAQLARQEDMTAEAWILRHIERGLSEADALRCN